MTDQLVVPSDIEAERQVVGACLLSPDTIPAIVARVTPDDFYGSQYRAVFAACCDLAIENQPVTVATVCNSLRKSEIDRESLGRIMEGVLPGSWDYWAERVVNTRKLRSIFDLGQEARQLAKLPPEDADSAISKLEQMLTDAGASTAGGGETSAHDAVATLRKRLDRYIHEPDSITGLETGWRRFDRILDGLQPGAVTIVYAPTSVFKSSFVQNIGWSVARQGIPALWFTTEMPDWQVMERLLQLEAGVSIRDARYRRELWRYEQQLQDAMEVIEEYPVWMCDRSELDIGFVRQSVLRMKRWHDIQLVIVDLVDFVSSARLKDGDVANETAVMRAMKGIAKQANVHILLTTHIAKMARDFRNMRAASLDVEEMKGSSAKSQDVDAAISLMVVQEQINLETGKVSWRAQSREERASRMREEGYLNIMASITKNRSGEMDDLIFGVNLWAGSRMELLEA